MHRKAMAEDTSSGSATRPKGVLAQTSSKKSLLDNKWLTRGVLVYQGLTALIRMPSAPHSAARFFTICDKAALVMAYRTPDLIAIPQPPATDDTRTTLPFPSFNSECNALVNEKADCKLVSKMKEKSSSVYSIVFLRILVPTLLTKQLISPPNMDLEAERMVSLPSFVLTSAITPCILSCE